jgi:DNA-binding response OmpR family regulator
MLIVAIEERERDLLAGRMRHAGHHVTAVRGGADAVRALTDPADPITGLVISEPLPDGRVEPLVRYARSIPGFADLPIIVLATVRSPARAAALYDAGADLVVAKPIDFDLLSRQIAALRRRAA